MTSPQHGPSLEDIEQHRATNTGVGEQYSNAKHSLDRMTTRRNVTGETPHLSASSVDTQTSSIAPAVPSSVIWTLLSFTFAMITLPIGSYFFTVAYVFNGNTTYAGALAAFMANVVLIGYVVVAMREDQAEQRDAAEKEKKAL